LKFSKDTLERDALIFHLLNFITEPESSGTGKIVFINGNLTSAVPSASN
jgi:hypothetical protein